MGILSAGTSHTELAPLVARLTRESIDGLADLIKRARDNGEIRADARPRAEASIILASMRGVMFQWLINPDHVTLSRVRDSSDGEHAQVARPLTEPVARSLEYWAATRGGRPALFEGDTVLTYREWNEYADLLADAFAARELGSGDVIAVRCRNRIEWAVIALACAKIDARLLTLDPDLAPRALRERIIASGASAVIVGDAAPVRIAPALEGLSLRLRATMDGAFPGFFNFWDLFPPVAQPRFGRTQPSLLAWTAGSAGNALPVGLPPRRAAPASISRPPVPETGVSLITVPLHRVWGPVQFWAALVSGRAVALMRTFDPASALDTIRHRRITHWSALPETFSALQQLGADAIRAADTSSLQELEIGAAQLRPRH